MITLFQIENTGTMRLIQPKYSYIISLIHMLIYIATCEGDDVNKRIDRVI